MRLHSKLRRRLKRKVPELNTTSTADISFMLLIFFLVTTNMDHDKGMMRKLPPLDKNSEAKAIEVERSKVMTVILSEDGSYHTENDNNPISDSALMHEMEDFIIRIGDEHIIEIKANQNASYDRYYHLHDLISQTYRAVIKKKNKTISQRISETFVLADKEKGGQS